MKIGIMQPYFFPYLGYWQLLAAVDKYVIYDDVNYIKGGWIARNNILLNGQKHMITLPLDNPSSFRKINEISITNNSKIREKLIRTIENAYTKAPHYKEVMPWITDLIMNSDCISELNTKSINKICNYLNVDTEIIVSSEMDKDDLLKGQEKVIHIVKKLGGDEYYNAIGGQELYDKERFGEEGIKLSFLQAGDIAYPQFQNDPIEGLSIIDVLMFNTPDEVRELLGRYELK